MSDNENPSSVAERSVKLMERFAAQLQVTHEQTRKVWQELRPGSPFLRGPVKIDLPRSGLLERDWAQFEENVLKMFAKQGELLEAFRVGVRGGAMIFAENYLKDYSAKAIETVAQMEKKPFKPMYRFLWKKYRGLTGDFTKEKLAGEILQKVVEATEQVLLRQTA